MVSITHTRTHLRAWRSRDVFDDDRGRRDVGVATDGRRWLVLYGVDDVHSRQDFPKDGVPRGPFGLIQAGVVHRVDKKLRGRTVWVVGAGHAQRTPFVQ